MIDLSERYSRQILFPPVGETGQARIRAARVLVCGAGGLGSTIAEILARSGVGYLRLVDRDVVELSNLQRQALYDEGDAAEGLPKAVAAARRIAEINREVELDPVVADINPENIRGLLVGADLVLDGFDNFAGRYLLNDAAVASGIPWVYAACIGGGGMAGLILPGQTPCFRCLSPSPPPPGLAATCDSAGILGPAAHFTAALSAGLALRWIISRQPPEPAFLLSIDLWAGRTDRLELPGPNPDCLCCGRREFEFLDACPERAGALCGGAIQILPATRESPDLAALAQRLADAGEVHLSPFMLRFRAEGKELTLFRDGRALIRGVDDPSAARQLLDRFIGS